MINTVGAGFTTGRKKIFCYEDSLNEHNVKEVVEAALLVHRKNVEEIEWLFELYRGRDALIEERIRTGINEDVNYKANVNYYSLIADYASNLFMQNPMVYVNVDGKEEVSKSLHELNKIHRVSNKYARDKTAATHAAICGVGYRFVEQHNRYNLKDSVLSPTNVFSLWGDDTDDEAIARVYITQVRDGVAGEDITQQVGENYFKTKERYTIYTDEYIYEFIEGEDEVVVKNAMPWGCPIIEYKLNPFYIGTFERVTNLIHMLSILRSDGVNGVVQSIAGFILGKNIGLPIDHEDDTEEQRQEKQKIRSQFRKDLKVYRQIWAEDSKEMPVSVEYIGTELFNADIDVLYESIIKDIITITRTPNSIMNLGASGNAGAAETASGMSQALEFAKNSEPYWFESAREQARIELDILHHQNKLKGLSIFDFDFALQRSVAVDKQTSSQAYATLVGSGVPPSMAAQFAEITADPESWEKKVHEYKKEQWKLNLERTEEERRLADDSEEASGEEIGLGNGETKSEEESTSETKDQDNDS